MPDGTSDLVNGETDSGALALAFTLRVLGIAADPASIRHGHGSTKAMGEADILRAARAFPVKARAVVSAPDRLARTPLPAIAAMHDGRFVVLGRVSETDILVQEADASHPRILPRQDFQRIWTGRLVLVTRRAALLDLHRRFDIGWFASAVAKYRKPVAEVLVASFFLQILMLLTPLFFQVVIDKVLVHRGLSTLDVLMIGLAGLAVFEVVLGGVRGYLMSHTTNRMDVELGARLFRHLFSLPLVYFQSRRVGDSVARIRELENIRQFITSSALTLVLDLAFTVVFLAVMFSYAGSLAWVVVAAFPFYIVLSLAVTPVFRRRLDERFRRGAENQAFLVETISGVETVKAMAIEPQMQRRWEESLAAYVSASFRATILGNWAGQSVTLINKVTTILVLYLGAGLVIANRMTVGELVAFNMLAGYVAAPVLRLAQLWQDLQQARLSVDRLGDILNTPPEPRGAGGRGALPRIRGDIRFEEVTFRYRPDAPPILSEVSLDIHAGEMVGIVGSSGSGKSTLAKLVQRLYVPERGRVLIDDVDIAGTDPVWLRRQMGLVLQENVLFNRSVRENIALADPGMPIERVIAAAELAGAHDFILGLPHGYDTEVGERGASLSGGQRQRIALARALVGDPRILVLDEATSALDYESEAVIRANMRRIAHGRTVIVIAHRLSTLHGADRIITVEKGRIVETGSPAELLRAGGRFAELHRLQSA